MAIFVTTTTHIICRALLLGNTFGLFSIGLVLSLLLFSKVFGQWKRYFYKRSGVGYYLLSGIKENHSRFVFVNVFWYLSSSRTLKKVTKISSLCIFTRGHAESLSTTSSLSMEEARNIFHFSRLLLVWMYRFNNQPMMKFYILGEMGELRNESCYSFIYLFLWYYC